MDELKYICQQLYDLSFPYSDNSVLCFQINAEEPQLLWTYLIQPPSL